MDEGDKLASSHAQKGIVQEREEHGLPYTKSGMRPSGTFNPTGGIRRETRGQMYEGMVGKVCAMFGTSIDCTPFINRVHVEELTGILKEFGLDERGTETMYDPISGRELKVKVFIGVNSYFRLKRMVDDLTQWRQHGPRDAFSGQAVKGRAREGGTKFGEMEVKSAIASDSSQIVFDSTVTQGAPQQFYICDQCHGLAYPDPKSPSLIRCDQCGALDPSVTRSIIATRNLLILSSKFRTVGQKLSVVIDRACV